MFLIFNVSGLLVGMIGLLIGFITFCATGYLWAALLAIAAVWAGAGMWWWRGDPVAFPRDPLAPDVNPFGAGMHGQPPALPNVMRRRRPFPSIFFIPLPILAVPVVGLAIAAAVTQPAMTARQKAKASDGREAQLKAAKENLRGSMAAGDQTMATAVHQRLLSSPFDGSVPTDCAVYVSPEADATKPVLVLVSIENLKKFSDTARHALLDAVEETVRAGSTTRPVYIGVKGKLLFGAIRTPRTTRVGSAVDDDLLLDFFGPTAAMPAGRK